MRDYLGRVCAESAAVPGILTPFETTLTALRARFDALAKAAAKHADIDADKKQMLADAVTELRDATTLYRADAQKLLASLSDNYPDGLTHAAGVRIAVGFYSGFSLEGGSHGARQSDNGPTNEQIQGIARQVYPGGDNDIEVMALRARRQAEKRREP